MNQADEQAVARGVEWLDAAIVGWRERIDTSLLDLGECYACVLGQLAGEWVHADYADVLNWLTRGVGPEDADRFMIEHGFTLYRRSAGEIPNVVTAYTTLTDTWRALLDGAS